MKTILFNAAIIVTVCLMIVGCHGDIHAVWNDDSGRVPVSARAPDGFKITPHDAQVIAEKELGMRKTIQHIYADSKYYYIVDGFLGSNASKAAKTGYRVDGRTGKAAKFNRQ
jgi:hypothetical protein